MSERATEPASETIVPLDHRPTTRAGWRAVAAVCLWFAAVIAWSVVWSPPSRVAAYPALVALGALYAWAGLAALDLGRGGAARVRIGEPALTVELPGLLRTPLEIRRVNVAAALVDIRPQRERQIAAATRRGGIVTPSFLDPTIPVISSSPTAHSRYGSAIAPNVVLRLEEPVEAPSVPRGVRLLVRISTGKNGRYAGPRPGAPMRAVRFTVTDPEAVARAFDGWGVLESEVRDARYLAPIRPRNVRRWRRDRMILAAIVGGAAVLLVARIALG